MCSINEKTARNIIFEVLNKSKVLNRLDLSDGFWKQFSVQNKSFKKQVRLYEVENISNTSILAIVINAKQYFEKYKDFSINKNTRVWKRILHGWISERLTTLHEYCFESKPKKIEEKRFQIINDLMQWNLLKRINFLG